MGLALSAGAAGCHTPPPPRVPVPAPENRDVMLERDPVKPLPEPSSSLPPQAPISAQPGADASSGTPLAREQRAFVDAYARVNRPRIAVVVNRTLEGDIVSVVNRTPAEGHLRPDQYDAAQAASLDFHAIETVLTDWLGSDGQVTVISPATVRQMLTPEHLKELETGQPKALGEIARQFSGDVLVQVQARPVQQTAQGLGVRLVAEAINTQGGESIARASVDVPPPADKPRLETAAVSVARSLADGMTVAWADSRPPPPPDAPKR